MQVGDPQLLRMSLYPDHCPWLEKVQAWGLVWEILPTQVMYLLTQLCVTLICTSARIWLFESNDLCVNYSALMITIIMIYHVLFSILIKETLSKFRRLSPESALQMIYFCQHPSERETFCLCDMHWRFTKSKRCPYLNTKNSMWRVKGRRKL